MTDFGGEEQDLDQAEAAADGPLRAWTTSAQPGTKYLGIKAVEIMPRGRTHKAASLQFFGDEIWASEMQSWRYRENQMQIATRISFLNRDPFASFSRNGFATDDQRHQGGGCLGLSTPFAPA